MLSADAYQSNASMCSMTLQRSHTLVNSHRTSGYYIEATLRHITLLTAMPSGLCLSSLALSMTAPQRCAGVCRTTCLTITLLTQRDLQRQADLHASSSCHQAKSRLALFCCHSCACAQLPDDILMPLGCRTCCLRASGTNGFPLI